MRAASRSYSEKNNYIAWGIIKAVTIRSRSACIIEARIDFNIITSASSS